MNWKAVIGYEGWYEVSNVGDVKRIKPGQGTYNGKLLRHLVAQSGHHRVQLLKNGKDRLIGVHVLVAEAFIGPAPTTALYLVCHKDDNPHHNSLDNIAYMTYSENHPNSQKTHCKRGHPFTKDNTYRNKGGGRKCKQCTLDNRRQQRISKKENLQMTPKQQNLIENLRDELKMTDEDISETLEDLIEADVSNWENATVSDATILIDELIRMKRQGDR